MDADLFDDLTRGLTSTSSRRRAIKGLVAGVAAGLLGRVGLEEAAAACLAAGKRCGDGRRCCTGAACKGGICKCKTGLKPCRGKCIPQAKCCTDANCGGGATCQSGTCACPAGKKDCNGTCIDAASCCGNGECGGGKTCQNGACTCPAGQRDCGGTCRGCCGNQDCGGGKNCDNGTCRCRYWQKDCNGTCSECCTNQDCGPGGACNSGECTFPKLVEEQSDSVGDGKRIETKATLYGNDQLVVQARTINSSWVGGLRGRVLVVAVDERERAIWVSETIQCATRCSVPDISCASEGLETFTQNFPAHPEAGNVIRKYARRLDIYHSDGPSPITFADRWKENIKQAQDIAREIQELADIVW